MKMTTDDLIARLSDDLGDAPALRPTSAGRLVVAALLVAASSFVLSSWMYGLRPDGPASGWVGALLWATVASGGLSLLTRARLPEAATPRLLLIPAGVLAALMLALAAWAVADGRALIRVDHVVHCLQKVGVLALAPFVGLSIFVRRGAPASPMATGALAGLVAAAVGALAYSISCPISDPIASLSAHTFTVLMLGAAGAVAGARLYAW